MCGLFSYSIQTRSKGHALATVAAVASVMHSTYVCTRAEVISRQKATSPRSHGGGSSYQGVPALTSNHWILLGIIVYRKPPCINRRAYAPPRRYASSRGDVVHMAALCKQPLWSSECWLRDRLMLPWISRPRRMRDERCISNIPIARLYDYFSTWLLSFDDFTKHKSTISTGRASSPKAKTA